MAGGPVERRGQPRAAVELAAVAAARLPVARGVDQVLVQAAALGVLLEPAAQARPLAQQRLVRDLERLLVRGHEPAVDEGRQRRRGVLVALGSSSSSGTRRRTNAALLLAGVGEPQQDPPGGPRSGSDSRV